MLCSDCCTARFLFIFNGHIRIVLEKDGNPTSREHFCDRRGGGGGGGVRCGAASCCCEVRELMCGCFVFSSTCGLRTLVRVVENMKE